MVSVSRPECVFVEYQAARNASNEHSGLAREKDTRIVAAALVARDRTHSRVRQVSENGDQSTDSHTRSNY